MERFKIINGYIHNIPFENGFKTFYEGEILPENYKPPKNYILNKIVEKIKIKTKKNKNGGLK